jgi:hypothetical protein
MVRHCMKRSASADSEPMRVRAVGDHQHLVVLEQVRDLRLVGLDLLEGLPDVGVHVGRVLQLDDHQRQAVHEEHDVRPAGVVRPLHGTG